MATSGKINGTAKNNGSSTSSYSFWADWKINSQNIAGNSSNITVWLRIKCTAFADGAWALDKKPSVTLRVNGSTVSPTINFIDTRNYVTCTFATWTGNVGHNADGTLSCPIVASFVHYGSSSLDAGDLSGTASLDKINRASTISSADAKTLGSACAIRWTPALSSFRYRLKFSIGSYSYTTGIIWPNRTTQYTYTGYTFPIEMAEQIKSNPPTGTVGLTLYTYSDAAGATKIGETTASVSVTVPANEETMPEVSAVLSPVNEYGSQFDGIYIQGKTKIQAQISASGKFGASISSYSVKAGGKEYGSPYIAGPITSTGEATITATATDQRGITGSVSHTVQIQPYSKPALIPSVGESNIVCVRATSQGDPSEEGQYLLVKCGRSFSKLNDGSQRNFCQIRYRSRTQDTYSFSEWRTILDRTDTEQDYVETVLIGVVPSAETAYVVEIGVLDDLGESASIQFSVPARFAILDIPRSSRGRRIGILRSAALSDEPGIDVGAPVYGGMLFSLKRGTELFPTDNGSLDINTVTEPGCYFVSSKNAPNTQNGPSETSSYRLICAELADVGDILHIALLGYDMRIRSKQNGEWKPWRTLGPSDEVSYVVESGSIPI